MSCYTAIGDTGPTGPTGPGFIGPTGSQFQLSELNDNVFLFQSENGPTGTSNFRYSSNENTTIINNILYISSSIYSQELKLNPGNIEISNQNTLWISNDKQAIQFENSTIILLETDGTRGPFGGTGPTGPTGDLFNSLSELTSILPVEGSFVDLIIQPNLSYIFHNSVFVSDANDSLNNNFEGIVESWDTNTGEIRIYSLFNVKGTFSQSTQYIVNLDGIDGYTGIIGFTGATGVIGDIGSTGPTGNQGPTGPIGHPNIPSLTGYTGPTGFIGSIGPTGLRGPTGLGTGPTGFTGSTGFQGPTGSIGPAGPKGSEGPTGFAPTTTFETVTGTTSLNPNTTITIAQGTVHALPSGTTNGFIKTIICQRDTDTINISNMNSGLGDSVSDIAFNSVDNFLYAVGGFVPPGGVASQSRVARWNGSTWSFVGSGFSGSVGFTVNAVAVNSNGIVYAGGNMTGSGGTTINRIAQWNGSSWSQLGSGLDNTCWSLGIGPDNSVYAGGWFTTVNGVSNRNRIARWFNNTWSAMENGLSGGSGICLAIAVTPDNSRVYAGGSFTTAGTASVSNIAQWDGSTWSELGTGLNEWCYAFAIGPTGILYVGGNFTQAGGIPVGYVAQWNGTSWSAVGIGFNGRCRKLKFGPDGYLYAVGEFTTADSKTVNRIARWDGSSWSGLGTGFSGTVNSLDWDLNSNLNTAGSFSTVNGISVSNVAEFDIFKNKITGTFQTGQISTIQQKLLLNGGSLSILWNNSRWHTVSKVP